MHRFRIITLCVGLAAGSSILLSAPKGDAAKGKVVLDQYCTACHSAESAEKDPAKPGPGLKGVFKKDKMSNGKKPTDVNVRARIDEGGGGMPPYKDLLSDSDKDDLLAYLKTL